MLLPWQMQHPQHSQPLPEAANGELHPYQQLLAKPAQLMSNIAMGAGAASMPGNGDARITSLADAVPSSQPAPSGASSSVVNGVPHPVLHPSAALSSSPSAVQQAGAVVAAFLALHCHAPE